MNGNHSWKIIFMSIFAIYQFIVLYSISIRLCLVKWVSVWILDAVLMVGIQVSSTLIDLGGAVLDNLFSKRISKAEFSLYFTECLLSNTISSCTRVFHRVGYTKFEISTLVLRNIQHLCVLEGKSKQEENIHIIGFTSSLIPYMYVWCSYPENENHPKELQFENSLYIFRYTILFILPNKLK